LEKLHKKESDIMFQKNAEQTVESSKTEIDDDQDEDDDDNAPFTINR
jgi:hypothetical protein